MKAYEPGMRYLIDNYIVAEDAKVIGDFDDFTLLDFILAQREKLRAMALNLASRKVQPRQLRITSVKGG